MALTAGPAFAQSPPRVLPPAIPSQYIAPPVPSPPVFSGPGMVGSSGVVQAGGRTGAGYGRPGKDEYDEVDIRIKTDIPPLAELTQRDSEAELFDRWRQEARKRPGSERVPFPQEKPLTKEPYKPRPFAPLVKFVEPAYVAHHRLTMEQPNWERAGWDLGFFQPGVCLAGFYWDTLTLPYQLLKRPLNQMDTSAGKCLPGDPDPLVLYPPEFSLTGLGGEAAALTAGFLVFPPWLNLK